MFVIIRKNQEIEAELSRYLTYILPSNMKQYGELASVHCITISINEADLQISEH